MDFHCGDYSTILLLSNGGVLSFGYNGNGALGTGDSVSSTTPVTIRKAVIGSYRKIIKIAHKNEIALALSDDRKLFVWGANNICQCATGKECTTQWEPDFASIPTIDNIHDMSILKEGSISMYSYKATIGFLLGGRQSISPFSNIATGTYKTMISAIRFNIKYTPPMERKYPVYENATHRSIVTESTFFSYTAESFDLVSFKKSALDKPVSTKAQIGYFNAFSFHSTHDFQIDGVTFYFGGFVNNTLSDRIISKRCLDCLTVYNQTLPYPVASGMVALVDEFLYIFGGLTLDRDEIVPTYKVIRANVSNLLMWEEMKKEFYIPFPIYNGAVCVLDDSLYLLGGRAYPSNQPTSEIYIASIFDMKWRGTNSLLPYPLSETNLIMDPDGIYLIGGFRLKYKPNTSIIKANKNTPLQWFDTLQRVSDSYLGITYPYVDNSTTLYIYSYDFSSRYLYSGQNISLSTYKLTFTNQPFTASTIVTTKIDNIDGAFIEGDYGLKSCSEYLARYPNQGSGFYWIWPDENSLNFVVYCEQSIADGGWTLVSSRSNPYDPSFIERVVGDYSGGSLADDKWNILLSTSSYLMYKTKESIETSFTTADLSELKDGGNCKRLAYSLKDPILYWRELDCDQVNQDYCFLGFGPSRSADLFTRCYKNPFRGSTSSSAYANIYLK